jgi:hypothetical protein
MSTYTEALAFQAGLSKGGHVPWPVARIFNVLLAAAKAARPNSITVAAIDPLEDDGTGNAAGITAEGLRTMADVVVAALKPSKPSPRRRSARVWSPDIQNR